MFRSCKFTLIDVKLAYFDDGSERYVANNELIRRRISLLEEIFLFQNNKIKFDESLALLEGLAREGDFMSALWVSYFDKIFLTKYVRHKYIPVNFKSDNSIVNQEIDILEKRRNRDDKPNWGDFEFKCWFIFGGDSKDRWRDDRLDYVSIKNDDIIDVANSYLHLGLRNPDIYMKGVYFLNTYFFEKDYPIEIRREVYSIVANLYSNLDGSPRINASKLVGSFIKGSYDNKYEDYVAFVESVENNFDIPSILNLNYKGFVNRAIQETSSYKIKNDPKKNFGGVQTMLGMFTRDINQDSSFNAFIKACEYENAVGCQLLYEKAQDLKDGTHEIEQNISRYKELLILSSNSSFKQANIDLVRMMDKKTMFKLAMLNNDRSISMNWFALIMDSESDLAESAKKNYNFLKWYYWETYTTVSQNKSVKDVSKYGATYDYENVYDNDVRRVKRDKPFVPEPMTLEELISQYEKTSFGN